MIECVPERKNKYCYQFVISFSSKFFFFVKLLIIFSNKYCFYAAALLLLSSGYSNGWSSPAIPKLLQNDTPITITAGEGAWIINMIDIGVLLSAIPAGWLLNRYLHIRLIEHLNK